MKPEKSAMNIENERANSERANIRGIFGGVNPAKGGHGQVAGGLANSIRSGGGYHGRKTGISPSFK